MRRDQILLAGVLSAILVVFLFAFFLPQTAKISETKSDLHRVRSQVMESVEFNRRFQELQNRRDTYEATLARLHEQLPPEEALDHFLLSVSKLLAEHKLQAGTLEPLPPVKGQRLREIPMKLACAGPFQRLYRFLVRLEQLPRIKRITEVTMSGPQNFDRGLVHLSIQLGVFSLATEQGTSRPCDSGQGASAADASGKKT